MISSFKFLTAVGCRSRGNQPENRFLPGPGMKEAEASGSELAESLDFSPLDMCTFILVLLQTVLS